MYLRAERYSPAAAARYCRALRPHNRKQPPPKSTSQERQTRHEAPTAERSEPRSPPAPSKAPRYSVSTTSRPDPLSPQSQPFSRSYGSVLPTSLTYIILCNQRLCTLETCCGYGYGLARDSMYGLPRIFKGRRQSIGHGKSCRALRAHGTLSPDKLIPGLGARLQRKENSSRVYQRRLRVRLRCRSRAPARGPAHSLRD